jgi:inosine-uridine nucleoside N-ribohydrolase
LKDVLGVAAVALEEAVKTKPECVDIEVRGELTRGMTVLDHRPDGASNRNVDWAVSADGTEIRSYLWRLLYER